jgi:ornithine carbamoyltransferase
MTTIATNSYHAGSLLRTLDMNKPQFLDLVQLASQLKLDKAQGREQKRLTGKNIALLFEKNSTRTRCAFEVAAHDQGAHVTFLGPGGSHLGGEESIADTARVLGRMFDGIEFRGYTQDSVEQLAKYAGVPVWNGLTDSWHPTQMLADVMTMIEHSHNPLEQISYAFVGDGRNNVARSLLITGALLGMDVRIGAPRALWPPQDVIDEANHLAEHSGGRILITEEVLAAVRGVEFVYTDVWVSMGETAEQWHIRVPQLLPYRVTEQLMAATGRPDSKFLHCLPSVHDRSTDLGERLYQEFALDGAEVTDEVFQSDRSVVFDQAANRLHTIKAVLVSALAT